MRLVFRDRGCVVCLAGRTQRTYKNSDDSGLFEGAHIIGVARHELVCYCLCKILFLF